MIARATSPTFLLLPPVVALIRDAYEKDKNVTWDKALQGLLPIIHEPETGLFVGEEGGELKGLILVMLPNNPFTPCPIVGYWYCRGSRQLANELIAVAVEYVTRNGYNRAWFVNGNGVADKAYARRIEKLAGPAHPVGSILEVDLRGRGS